MGVNLRDIIFFEKLELKDLEGLTIAIDASNWIYQFLSSIRQRDGTPLMDRKGRVTSHLVGILHRTSALVENNIKPVYVFDGKSLALKSETISERTRMRLEAEKRWKEALKKKDLEKARKYASRASRISKEIIESSKELLDAMGIPYIQAPNEGEAQAVYLVKNGDAWAVASQDYDCLLFGAPRVIRNLAISSDINLELLELDKILKKLGISREQLIDIALLVGTDFNPGVKGIGAKRGLELIKKFGDIYTVIKRMNLEVDFDPEVLRNIFLKPKVKKKYKIVWKRPDKEKMIKFLCDEHDFSKERVLNVFKKLKKVDFTQRRLEEWF
ncbi:flap endonuclease 1 [Methanothermus fervidus DSM 2088]|uniref:Flap endonuclease 1 n=1 Tax=Methanothermus fervidus (strain ATCC 43054 / DSM 2088 / JCM 10308 / V24 S) TaxID=523846 RepID=E3GVZ8_METFV|nr:flap endonuclease-1 [Methanothermus fervidus]ADP77763.1 flap endonuclease 1 [Methanothermus fervidus DSM 2088]